MRLSQLYPDIHHNLRKSQIGRRNWLATEYGSVATIKWDSIAEGVYDDVPKIESAIIAALKAEGCETSRYNSYFE